MTSPWASFDPARIPTKVDLKELDRFLAQLPPGARVLDLGCGSGGVSRHMTTHGFDVTGVDVNAEAVERATGRHGSFFVRDITDPAGLRLDAPPYAAVICQLVLSIVGTIEKREQLLQNVWAELELGGQLYLSASEVSDELNPAYEKLYRDDFEKTGERYTYFSRDENGKVLYMTHHFTGVELSALIEGAGFEMTRLSSVTESSSRRKDQQANFLYATAHKP